MSTVDAMQTTLAAEHAAIWLLGLLGAQAEAGERVPPARARLAEETAAAYRVHRSRRDQLQHWLRERGVTPAAAVASYVVPDGIDSTGGIARAGLGVEQACATAYAALVANTVTAEREWAIAALTDAAARSLAFRGTPEIFPGLGELAGH